MNKSENVVYVVGEAGDGKTFLTNLLPNRLSFSMLTPSSAKESCAVGENVVLRADSFTPYALKLIQETIQTLSEIGCRVYVECSHSTYKKISRIEKK